VSEDSLEAPEADTAEQRDADRADVPLEADSADTAEQARELGADDSEDYR
jgi:hypothetical protein